MNPAQTAPRVLVVGCGGIGGVLLSRMVEAGQRVAAVARREEIASVLRTRGPVLRDEKGERTVRGDLEVFVQPPREGAYDFILLATPPNGVEAAARDTAHLLAPDGAMVVLQNGLCEELVAQVVGETRVLGAIVAWGASSPETGVYERTSSGGFMLGALSGEQDPRLPRLAEVLGAVSQVAFTGNLRGARWSKLAINCAISTLGTVGGSRVGPLLRHRFVRRLAMEVFTEVFQVARAEGVKVEKVASTVDLEWLTLGESERHASGSPSLLLKHAMLLAIGARYRRLRSSMLAAIERGREPPVDFLNGEVVRRGKAHGIPVPVNERLLEAVHAMARRELAPGVETLRRIHEQTRPQGR
ncbi:2-dehydropantoate 2-reductase [Archangium violaceum]|uniref:ketopantoate reductase family protein n=1 Tax=Archangium violaceum TaxID=83451 RepID=UPI0019523CE8|nr:2-dehydropantoate 2-reductase [Archangium violaceum]QRN96248.1 2-dehydropantoate 2-reductase [Archangium violaceum]